jgi:hypothetical protein
LWAPAEPFVKKRLTQLGKSIAIFAASSEMRKDGGMFACCKFHLRSISGLMTAKGG